MLIEDNDILPAAFSLSVFNAPAALVSIAFGLKGGYSAIYPGKNSFNMGIMLAEASLQGEEPELIFIYADEEIPSEYNEMNLRGEADRREVPGKYFPLAFAFLLTRKQGDFSIPLSSLKTGTDTPGTSAEARESRGSPPEDFLKRLLLIKRDIHNNNSQAE